MTNISDTEERKVPGGASIANPDRSSGVRLLAWVLLAIAIIVVGGALLITRKLTAKPVPPPPPPSRSDPSAPGPDNSFQRLGYVAPTAFEPATISAEGDSPGVTE